MSRTPPRDELAAVMSNLALDRVTAEVFAALDAAGVKAVLLKGPSVVRWLYPVTPRRYRDVDLLLAPDAEPAAARVLLALGFAPEPGTGRPDPGIADQHAWSREDAGVDLHVTLHGIEAPPTLVWRELAASPDRLAVGGRTVPVLALPARLLHIALHAAQHGPDEPQALVDLERALAVADDRDWDAARALADRVGAAPALGAGLRLAPSGRAVAERLDLPRRAPVPVELRASGASTVALGLERLATTEGTGARMSRVLRAVAPTPSFLRWWSPLARRGPAGLALAYAWRPVWLAGQLVPAWRAWRRARRDP